VQAVVNRSNLGRFEVHMILYQFIQSGMLKLKDPLAEAAAAAGKSPTPAPAIEPNESDSDSGTRVARSLLGNLMGRGKSPTRSEREVLNFISPIGAIGWFISELVRR